MARKKPPPPLTVTHDSDGGLTIDDKDGTGLIVSIIRRSNVSGDDLAIEVYPYERGYAAKYVEGYSRSDRAYVHMAYREPYTEENE